MQQACRVRGWADPQWAAKVCRQFRHASEMHCEWVNLTVVVFSMSKICLSSVGLPVVWSFLLAHEFVFPAAATAKKGKGGDGADCTRWMIPDWRHYSRGLRQNCRRISAVSLRRDFCPFAAFHRFVAIPNTTRGNEWIGTPPFQRLEAFGRLPPEVQQTSRRLTTFGRGARGCIRGLHMA